VVEDDIDVSFIMKRRLSSLFPKSHIEVSKTLLGGQKYLYENKSDLIFLDLNLPDNMGASSVKDLKPYARNTPIVVTTGLANELTIEEVMKAGAAELVLKTDIDKDFLTKILTKYLGEEKAETKAEA
jgi:response regulator of citrate/malate metabolism